MNCCSYVFDQLLRKIGFSRGLICRKLPAEIRESDGAGRRRQVPSQYALIQRLW
jgi:hypothetical protein